MQRINDDVCRVYAKMPQYRRRVSETVENVSQMLGHVSAPYIAFSCGKDSSVMADLILQQDSTVPLRFLSSGETRILHNVDTVLNYFRDKYGAKIEEINIDRVFSDEWQSATFDEHRKAGRRDIQTLDNSEFDSVFMGLRIEESRGRAISLRSCKTDGLPQFMYRYKNRDYYRMCPMARWKTEDIGAYILENGLPVLDWYKSFGYDSRTTARLTGDSVRQNTIIWMKYKNPSGYARLVQRFPELGIYS